MKGHIGAGATTVTSASILFNAIIVGRMPLSFGFRSKLVIYITITNGFIRSALMFRKAKEAI